MKHFVWLPNKPLWVKVILQVIVIYWNTDIVPGLLCDKHIKEVWTFRVASLKDYDGRFISEISWKIIIFYLFFPSLSKVFCFRSWGEIFIIIGDSLSSEPRDRQMILERVKSVSIRIWTWTWALQLHLLCPPPWSYSFKTPLKSLLALKRVIYLSGGGDLPHLNTSPRPNIYFTRK